jgi:molybdopterin converting factor small subunit
MQVKVLLFGPAAAAAGCDSLTVSVGEGARCRDVLAALGRANAPLGAIADAAKGARLAVNHAFADATQPIQPTDEVALISMVSGG